MTVVASKEEGSAKGTETTHLRVRLLDVANLHNELFDRHIFTTIRVLVVLCFHTCHIDQIVRISCKTIDNSEEMLINGENLLRMTRGFEKRTHILLLSCEYDTFFGKHTDSAAGLVDSFNGVLHLQ